MDHELAREIDAQLRLLGQSENLSRAFRAWTEAAVAYAEIRARWSLMTASERADQDHRRTALHNVAIDALNRLSREARAEGVHNAWRAILGDDRRRIGDFACWCALFRGLDAR